VTPKRQETPVDFELQVGKLEKMNIAEKAILPNRFSVKKLLRFASAPCFRQKGNFLL
jgi:hypothetical protein